MKLASFVLALFICAGMPNLAAAVDDWMGCDYRNFCSRHREYMLNEYQTTVPPYSPSENRYDLDIGSYRFYDDKGMITAKLHRATHDQSIADDLLMSLWLYQDGIIRVTLEE